MGEIEFGFRSMTVGYALATPRGHITVSPSTYLRQVVGALCILAALIH